MKTDTKLIHNETLDQLMANADFENGLSVDEVPILKARQARKNTATNRTQMQQDIPTNVIEADVWQLIRQHSHNPHEMARMNGVLRSLFAY